MEGHQDQIEELIKRLVKLEKYQAAFSREIAKLRRDINKLQQQEATTIPVDEPSKTSAKPLIQAGEPIEEYVPPLRQNPTRPTQKVLPKSIIPDSVKADWEKFIGENLINKIGILITILGVGIGAKYSIDNELVSPLTRIILGYLFGAGLLGFGIKLKEQYNNYSAVLVSGAIAILYFITYFAYSFYGLIPQLPAFGLMVLFTIFSVIAAINYDQQVIALIGLVGAYGIPFLLGDGSGNIVTMFSYMAIINIGILIIAFKKYWKNVHRTAFILTWLIFSAWFVTDYKRAEHFGTGFLFAGIFFATFYVLFLAYKLIRKEQFARRDIWLLLANSFLFYGFGYWMLDGQETGKQFLGLFTLANAGIHFGVSTLIHRQKLADKNLFYLVVGLVLIFLTIAIPVQLDGSWVTLIWAGEAALLFWIGRTKGVPFYEKMAYPLMVVASMSLLEDWSHYTGYYPKASENRITPLLNIHFLTSLLVAAAFGFINWINQKSEFEMPNLKWSWLTNLFKVLMPVAFLVVLYFAFFLEINNYFMQLYADSSIGTSKDGSINFQVDNYNQDLLHFKSIWQINYTLLFFSILTFINVKWIKQDRLKLPNLILNGLVIVVFLSGGLFALRELQQSYTSNDANSLFEVSQFHIIIRYLSLLLFGGFLYLTYRYLHNAIKGFDLGVVLDLVLHSALLVVASSEVIYWMEMGDAYDQSTKLGLSILWGIYSLFLIVLGIWKRKKHLRLAAMGLFAITLFKLFFYDLIHLSTIEKTIVLISLGGLLLFISFLYNRYKHLITDESEN